MSYTYEDNNNNNKGAASTNSNSHTTWWTYLDHEKRSILMRFTELKQMGERSYDVTYYQNWKL